MNLSSPSHLSQVNRSTAEMLLDEFYVIRLRQMIWQSLRDNRLTVGGVSVGGGGKNSFKNMTEVSDEALSSSIMKAIEEYGGKQVICNAINSVYRKNNLKSAGGVRNPLIPSSSSPLPRRPSRTVNEETITPIKDARFTWELGISEEVLAMTAEANRQFSIDKSGESWINPLLEKTFSMEQRESVRYLFDGEDLLETAVGIQASNINLSYVEGNLLPSLGMLKLSLCTMSCYEASSKYLELSHQCFSHVGLDEGYSGNGDKFSHQRHEEGDQILKTGTLLDARMYLRRGVLPGQRAKMWRLALGFASDETIQEINHFERMLQEVHNADIITDELFIMDVLSTCDDPDYFIFEETLRELMLCFARDEYVRETSTYLMHKIVENEDSSLTSGVQPFLGLAAYFAPLCYTYKRGASLYTVARESYCQLWCKLSVLSGDSGTLLHICNTFENLLLESQPRLFLHLVNIGVNPLQIAFSWIQLGFVGILEVDQLLILWDRVIGYMDTTILGVFAASIFVYRAESLLMCTSAVFAERIIGEMSRIKVVPLLQLFLLKSNYNIAPPSS